MTTLKTLQCVISDINAELKQNGSTFFYAYQPINESHSIDLHDENGYVRTVEKEKTTEQLVEFIEENYTKYMV